MPGAHKNKQNIKFAIPKVTAVEEITFKKSIKIMGLHNYSAEDKLLRKNHQFSKLEKVQLNETIKCFKCDKEYSKWTKFNVHSCILKISKKCFHCNFVANGKAMLKEHLQKLHPGEEIKKPEIRVKTENQLSGNK